MKTFFSFFAFLVYAALLIVAILFAVSNRQVVSVSLFPLPYVMDTQLFLLALLLFAIGMLAGAFYGLKDSFFRSHRQRADAKRIASLENEIALLKANRIETSVPARVEKS